MSGQIIKMPMKRPEDMRVQMPRIMSVMMGTSDQPDKKPVVLERPKKKKP